MCPYLFVFGSLQFVPCLLMKNHLPFQILDTPTLQSGHTDTKMWEKIAHTLMISRPTTRGSHVSLPYSNTFRARPPKHVSWYKCNFGSSIYIIENGGHVKNQYTWNACEVDVLYMADGWSTKNLSLENLALYSNRKVGNETNSNLAWLDQINNFHESNFLEA